MTTCIDSKCSRRPIRYVHYFLTTTSTQHIQQTNTTLANLKPITAFLILLVSIISLPTMTSIFQRLTRPFTSSTLRFAPDSSGSAMNVPEGAQKATLAAGCFWGIEHMYRKDFGKKGLIDARVGYIGGDTQSPTYRAVCSGRTGRECLKPSSGIKRDIILTRWHNRRRSLPTRLRPATAVLPRNPRILLQDARLHDLQPTRSRRRQPIPQRHLLP